jgi:Uma2 family endonuclease
MTLPNIKISAQAFWDFVHLPENADKRFERINGEIVESMPGNLYVSAMAINIGFFFKLYLRDNDIGYVTGADGGYNVTDDDTFAPDVAFIRYERQDKLAYEGFGPTYPDLVVEIVSPSDLKDVERRINRKIEKYLSIPIPIFWLVFPARREVEVYEMGKKVAVLGEDGILDGGAILPGFKLPVKHIFPKQ